MAASVSRSWCALLTLACLTACGPKNVPSGDLDAAALDVDAAISAETDVAEVADEEVDVLIDIAGTDATSPADVLADVALIPDIIKDVDGAVFEDGFIFPALDVTAGSSDGMILIPAGTFWMGCNEVKEPNCEPGSKPQHKVTLSPYYIDPIEVTVAMYKQCVDQGFCPIPAGQSPGNDDCKLGAATWPNLLDRPVVCVTQAAARQFCKWRGNKFDLPTEARWEMAARGSCEMNGSTADDPACASMMRVYPWGDEDPTCERTVMGLYFTCPFESPSPCATTGCGADPPWWPGGSKPAGDSPYGLHDMAGNASEWLQDGDYAYMSEPQIDPVIGPTAYGIVQHRGGDFTTLYPVSLTASHRGGGNLWQIHVNQRGLRCVRAAD
jgi:formylglycine-generating enzyme required for sulfatase activity